jgi:hypothetical protein
MITQEVHYILSYVDTLPEENLYMFKTTACHTVPVGSLIPVNIEQCNTAKHFKANSF